MTERWSGTNDLVPSGSIKWNYQLLFDDDDDHRTNNEDGDDVMKDIDDDKHGSMAITMLSKAVSCHNSSHSRSGESQLISGQVPAAFIALASTDISPDTASIMLSSSPWIASDDSLTHRRMPIINAHRQLFGLMYHKPLDHPKDTLKDTVELLFTITRLADAYGSLSILTVPVEHAFRRLEPSIITSSSEHLGKLVYIATKARSFWLLRETVCRIVGDPSWPDYRISNELDNSNSLQLVLQKRQELRDIMKTMDLEILLLAPPKTRCWKAGGNSTPSARQLFVILSPTIFFYTSLAPGCSMLKNIVRSRSYF